MVRIACLAAGARAFAGSRLGATIPLRAFLRRARPTSSASMNLNAVEVAGYVEAIAECPAELFNFRAGLRGQTLVETIRHSSRAAARRDVS
jgi:hypothetical protein